MKLNNDNLRTAQKKKDDEFYTLMQDIEKEMEHYVKHFENKVIYMNCDNPEKSNFWKYFHLNFERFKLKKDN